MTDDRARRIREIRNRTKTDADDGDATDANADDVVENSSASDADDGDATEAGADDSSESDTADASGSDDESTASDGDGSSTGDESTSGESPPLEDRSGTDQQSPESEADDESERERDETTSDDEPAEDVASPEPTADVESSQARPTADASSAGVAAGTASAGEQTVGAAVATADDDSEGVVEASLQGAIAGMSDTVTVDERVGEATVDATAIAQQSDVYGEAAAGRERVFDRGDSLIASTNEEDTVQMLEFFLDEDRYAIEIERISAIVEMKEITRFPRGPAAIDGVTDLRGEITGVLDPTAMLDIERNEPSEEHYIVVLEREGDKQKLGIRVTDVSQAVTYRESQIDETGTVMDNDTGDHEFVEGIVKKKTEDGTELVAWLNVDMMIEDAEMQYAPGEKYSEQRL